jgi:hypothetical protein
MTALATHWPPSLMIEGTAMDTMQSWGGSGVVTEANATRSGLPTYALHIFLISFASLYYVANARLLFFHFDLGWHLAAGDLIRERTSIPYQDPWSFTLADKQWYNLSWLWDALASLIFQYTSFAGLLIFVIACGAIIVGYLTSLCVRCGASTIAVGIAVLSACLLYPAFATPPNIYLAASPNTATMLFSVMFYAECLRRTRLYLLPLIMVLWVNLHGGFLLAFLILGIFGSVALLKRDWSGFRSFLFAGAASLVAVLVNPYGWHIYEGLTATVGHFVQANITEWWPYYLNMTLPGSIPGMVYMLAFVSLELRHRSTCRIPVEARLISWLFLFLGFYQYRYMSFFFIFSTVPMALHIDRLMPKLSSDAGAGRSFLAAGVVAACVLPFSVVHALPALEPAQMLTEQDARYLEKNFAHARVLNNWNAGGLLIYYTRGKVGVFVDGRAATAYPDELLRDYFKLVAVQINESAWDEVLAKYKIDAVLWVRAHQELKQFLVEKRGWKEQYVGPYETVYVKP